MANNADDQNKIVETNNSREKQSEIETQKLKTANDIRISVHDEDNIISNNQARIDLDNIELQVTDKESKKLDLEKEINIQNELKEELAFNPKAGDITYVENPVLKNEDSYDDSVAQEKIGKFRTINKLLNSYILPLNKDDRDILLREKAEKEQEALKKLNEDMQLSPDKKEISKNIVFTFNLENDPENFLVIEQQGIDDIEFENSEEEELVKQMIAEENQFQEVIDQKKERDNEMIDNLKNQTKKEQKDENETNNKQNQDIDQHEQSHTDMQRTSPEKINKNNNASKLSKDYEIQEQSEQEEPTVFTKKA